MQYSTKRKRRLLKAQAQHLEDLEAEKRKLEFIRDSRHVSNALSAYLVQPHLTDHDRAEIREAMLYLCRGE